jgi:hypothetical protein
VAFVESIPGHLLSSLHRKHSDGKRSIADKVFLKMYTEKGVTAGTQAEVFWFLAIWSPGQPSFGLRRAD